jgi:DNA-binding protein YbaB
MGEPNRPYDPAAVSRAFEQTIAAAKEQRAQLEAAMTNARQQTYEGLSANELIRVTVDGRPRVIAVNIDPRALRIGAAPLAQAITEATNAAVRAAKDGANQVLLAGLGPGLRAAVADGLQDRTEGPERR